MLKFLQKYLVVCNSWFILETIAVSESVRLKSDNLRSGVFFFLASLFLWLEREKNKDFKG